MSSTKVSNDILGYMDAPTRIPCGLLRFPAQRSSCFASGRNQNMRTQSGENEDSSPDSSGCCGARCMFATMTNMAAATERISCALGKFASHRLW